MKYRTLSAIAALMNELTFFYNAFLFLSFANSKTIMSIGYWPWAFGGTVILLFNRWFLRKGRTLAPVIAANALLTSLWVFLGFMYFFHIRGLAPYGFAVALLISTTVRAVYLSVHEIPDRHMVAYTEICFIGTSLFFLIQMEPFKLPMNYIIPSLFVALLNILAIINARLFSEARGINISKLRGGLFLTAVFSILIGGIASVLTFMSAPFRDFVIQVAAAIKEIIIEIYLFIVGIFDRLTLWLNPKGTSERELMEFKFKLPKIQRREPLNIDISKLIPWISILLAATVIIYLFIKYRKMVFRRHTPYGTTTHKRIKKDSALWSKFKSCIKALFRKIHFFYLFTRMRHTPQGMFLVIERWGKRKGFPRKVSESPGAYLKRLMESDAWNNDLKDNKVTEHIKLLIKELEWKYYTRGSGLKHAILISKDELKFLSPYFQGR